MNIEKWKFATVIKSGAQEIQATGECIQATKRELVCFPLPLVASVKVHGTGSFLESAA